MKRTFFGSWWYIGFAMLAYYGIARIVFSIEWADPVQVVLSEPVCDAAEGSRLGSGSCLVTGRMTFSITGDKWFAPATQPSRRARLPQASPIISGPGADHFPGGDIAMGCALFLPWIVLFLPTAYVLLHQWANIFGRLMALVSRR